MIFELCGVIMSSLSAKTLVEIKKVRGIKSSTKAAATEKKNIPFAGSLIYFHRCVTLR